MSNVGYEGRGVLVEKQDHHDQAAPSLSCFHVPALSLELKRCPESSGVSRGSPLMTDSVS